MLTPPIPREKIGQILSRLPRAPPQPDFRASYQLWDKSGSVYLSVRPKLAGSRPVVKCENSNAALVGITIYSEFPKRSCA